MSQSQTSEIVHLGGCLCGGVRYELAGPLADIQLCHCSLCRKAQGSAFAANIPVDQDKLRLTSGEELLSRFESSPGKVRTFCGRCGSPLMSQAVAVPGVVRLRAGSLDAPTGARLGFHIFADSHADWWPLDDKLPRYSERPPA
ncbi:GFA family protein [Phenylobacterium sp.]|uniref:GFA family protein n=1 Tax=Phenylobacterium sp. TaxID=1871053 RepID=UPI0027303BA2|nr:GFA family protein [Phenylobacterium sp.]MDP1616889.1 GFA family protein [Phenylobacterium sp.]MDP1986231.1 GFA family protein [Phenylobacterium sp.]